MSWPTTGRTSHDRRPLAASAPGHYRLRRRPGPRRDPSGRHGAAPTDPEQIGCLRCSIAVKAALRRARERGYPAASPDDALALQQKELDRRMLWKRRYGPEPPETAEVWQAYEQANLRAEEALDTALYVPGNGTSGRPELCPASLRRISAGLRRPYSGLRRGPELLRYCHSERKRPP